MKKLILTIGLPRSGKTTWAISLGLPVVEPDAIRLALYGEPFIKQAEPHVWAIAKTMVSALFIAGHDEVVLCATNTNIKGREVWKSSEWTREFQIFETSAAECSKRALATNQEYLLDIIERMDNNYEALTKTELNPDEKGFSRSDGIGRLIDFGDNNDY